MPFVLARAGFAEIPPEEAAHFLDPLVTIQTGFFVILFLASASAIWFFGLRTIRIVLIGRFHPFLIFWSLPLLACALFFLAVGTALAVEICKNVLWLNRL